MIPRKGLLILKSLGLYKFLTRKQLSRLGVEKYNSALTKHCQPFLEAQWIGVMDATNFGIGHVYYLQKKGAVFLSKELKIGLNQINFCQNTPKLTSQTLFHRTGAIDCQIELYLACKENEAKIVFYDRDIDVLGSVRGAEKLVRKTRIPVLDNRHIEPDAIFLLDTPKGQKLFCLEFENEDYTKKSYQKVESHVHALNLKSPSKKYKHDKAHRTLFIYKNPATMKSIMEKVNENISGIGSWFLFKTYDEVFSPVSKNSTSEMNTEKSFMGGWRTANGDKVDIY